METKEIKIKVPELYDIDKENSTFDCIKLKPIQSRFSDYDGTKKIFGFCIGGGSAIIEIKEVDNYYNYKSARGFFATEKQAKSALAMAQISQIMANDDRFGGVVTDEEWNKGIDKYVLTKEIGEMIRSVTWRVYCILAFHTEEQRELFLEENEQLVKDYLMID